MLRGPKVVRAKEIAAKIGKLGYPEDMKDFKKLVGTNQTVEGSDVIHQVTRISQAQEFQRELEETEDCIHNSMAKLQV